MKQSLVKDITFNAVIAAIYVAVTFLCAPIAFESLQFRFSEILVLLVFFNRKYAFGIIIGTLISNSFSPFGYWDVIFGTLATAISCLAICFTRHLCLASFWPCLFNGLIIGAEIYLLGDMHDISLFFSSAGFVFLGELVCMLAGYILFMSLKKRKDFLEIIRANRNKDFKF